MSHQVTVGPCFGLAKNKLTMKFAGLTLLTAGFPLAYIYYLIVCVCVCVHGLVWEYYPYPCDPQGSTCGPTCGASCWHSGRCLCSRCGSERCVKKRADKSFSLSIPDRHLLNSRSNHQWKIWITGEQTKHLDYTVIHRGTAPFPPKHPLWAPFHMKTAAGGLINRKSGTFVSWTDAL